MKRINTLVALIGAAATTTATSSAIGAGGPAAPGLYHPEWVAENDRSAEPEPSDFRLINYFFTRGTVTNQLADPSGLRGVSLGPLAPGRNVGSGTRVGDSTEAFYIEQRWIPVLAYSPSFTDGLASFRAQFEVDFMWGQAANQLQHNQGGGLNADQVNLQTKNVNVAIYPTRNPGQLSILVGTQSVYDTIYDPTITSLSKIVDTGYKLSYIGTDGTGLSIFANYKGRWKATFLPIGAAQPNKATEDDARLAFAYLLTGDYVYELAPGTNIGASFWHLQDDTQGAAFAFEGLVKSGPGSAGLGPFTGVSRFNMERPTGNVEYLGAHFDHNIDFANGPLAASGFVMMNAGKFRNNNPDSTLLPEVSILGVGANLEVAYNYGQTAGDVITFESMVTSGDSDPNDDKFRSAFTLNNYGLPGAVWFDHKTLILFPFTNTVSNYTGAITDISNQGFGLVSAILSASMDVVPNKLNVKVGAAYAQSMAKPPAVVVDPNFSIERGRTVGAEVNLEVKYHIRYLMTVGLHLAYLSVGNFYDGNAEITKDPWAAFTTFTWYAF